MLTEVMPILAGWEEVGWIPGPVWKVDGELPAIAQNCNVVAQRLY